MQREPATLLEAIKAAEYAVSQSQAVEGRTTWTPADFKLYDEMVQVLMCPLTVEDEARNYV